MELVCLKQRLREKIGQRLNELTPEEVSAKSQIIQRRVLALKQVNEAKSIAAYASFAREVKTDALIGFFLTKSKFSLFLPRVDCKKKIMEFAQVKDVKELVPGVFGIRESQNGIVGLPEKIELFLVPGVAFDFCGNRLGRGAGYYDRYLARANKRAVKIGLAYQQQISPNIPVTANDVKMDIVVTEKQVVFC